MLNIVSMCVLVVAYYNILSILGVQVPTTNLDPITSSEAKNNSRIHLIYFNNELFLVNYILN